MRPLRQITRIDRLIPAALLGHDMFCFPTRLVLGLICWLSVSFVAKNAYAAFGDIVAQYNFSASSFVMSPTQPLMYATIPSQNAVAIINTNTLAVERRVFVGSGPVNLAFSPDGSKAYIANSASDFVVVFNTQTRTVVKSFLLPEQPQDVVFGSLNRLWVLGDSQIYQIDATTGASAGPSITDAVTWGGSLEISPDRNTLYYGNIFALYKYDASGTTPVLLLHTPVSMMIASNENLTLSHNGGFVCYGSWQTNGDNKKFRTSDFAALGSFNTNTAPYSQPLAFSPDDSLVYASTDYSGIKVFNANTFLPVRSFSDDLEVLSGKLAVDSTGRYLFAGYMPSPTPGPSNSTETIVLDTGVTWFTTNAASNITSSSATLNGTVNPNGRTTTVHFEYGITTNYGHTTASSSHTGNTTQKVSANITGLSPNTTYHFRLVGTNNGRPRYGNDKTFSTFSPTGPPVVATSAATNVASFSASLNGSVYPHGLSTTVYFQYGTTTGYGFTTAPQTKTGNTYQSVSANISGLSVSSTYHFRIVTTNSAGTRYGGDRTFTTLPATGFPIVTTKPATDVANFAATLNGSLDPHGLTTTVSFQYGTTTSYGHTTPMQSQTGNTYRNIAANISGLARNTTYHFRIIATNGVGTRYGSDLTFTTQ